MKVDFQEVSAHKHIYTVGICTSDAAHTPERP